MPLVMDMEDRVILDILNDVFLLQGRNPENFILISKLELCREEGDQEGDTWRTFRFPEWIRG